MNEYARLRPTTRFGNLPNGAALEVIRDSLIILTVEKWLGMEITDLPKLFRDVADEIEQRNAENLATLEAAQEHCTCEAEIAQYGPHHDEGCPRWMPF